VTQVLPPIPDPAAMAEACQQASYAYRVVYDQDPFPYLRYEDELMSAVRETGAGHTP
jgi:hypothetical protein